MSISSTRWMDRALTLARHAKEIDEVPVGALLVLDGKAIGEGFNQPISSNDPSAHAEIIALREGAKTLENYRLLNTTLYVTLEPCVMCVGAMIQARIERLVFGAYDPKTGAVSSVFKLLDEGRPNHLVDWEGGVMAQPCGDILRTFFQKRRE